jgi:hypothetical protein
MDRFDFSGKVAGSPDSSIRLDWATAVRVGT